MTRSSHNLMQLGDSGMYVYSNFTTRINFYQMAAQAIAGTFALNDVLKKYPFKSGVFVPTQAINVNTLVVDV